MQYVYGTTKDHVYKILCCALWDTYTRPFLIYGKHLKRSEKANI